MLELEVELQQRRKKIEWNKQGDPTFEELKRRLHHSGVPDDWCVEVLRGSKFFSPDLQTHIHGPKITVRAAPLLGIGDLLAEEECQADIQWTRWMKTAFEKVVSHVGRVYIVDTTNEEEVKNQRGPCMGTVGLMDIHGESICALHCIQLAVQHPERYKLYVSFPNYHRGPLSFEAKTRAMDADVDICVIEPTQPLKKPLTYLDLATDVREDEVVYCFFFPDDPLKHVTLPVLQDLLVQHRRPLDELPTIFPGIVCFSEWMQGVAAYDQPPDTRGGILVSRSGRVKGIHVKSFTCGELREKVNSENPEELRVAKKLCQKLSLYAPGDSVPAFMPPHGLVKLLGLEGGCELLKAAIRQNKVKVKSPAPKQAKTPSRLGRSTTRSRCATSYCKSTKNNRRRKLR